MQKILCFILLIVLQGAVNGGFIVLDHEKDNSRAWSISCSYSNDYNDFWTFGCATDPTDDIFPTYTGFWTACKKTCSIIYSGGVLPRPSQLILTSYIEGDATIEINGKENTSDEFTTVIEKIEASETPGWCQRQIDLSNSGITVLEIVLSSSQNGFVLIDKIDIDIGTNKLPSIELDTESDQLPAQWSDTCHYMDNHDQFWVWGCPIDVNPGNPIEGAMGYWSPCKLTSCIVDFETSPSVVPSVANVLAYVTGSAKIEITIPGLTESNPNPAPIVVKIISVAEMGESGWFNVAINLSEFPENFALSAELFSANDGVALLDAITIQVEAPGEELDENIFPDCTSVTSPTSTIPETSTDIAETSSTTDTATEETSSTTGPTTKETSSTDPATEETPPTDTSSTVSSTAVPSTTSPTPEPSSTISTVTVTSSTVSPTPVPSSTTPTVPVTSSTVSPTPQTSSTVSQTPSVTSSTTISPTPVTSNTSSSSPITTPTVTSTTETNSSQMLLTSFDLIFLAVISIFVEFMF